MRDKAIRIVTVMVCFLSLLMSGTALAKDKDKDNKEIDAQAEKILRSMCDFLAAQKGFIVQEEVYEDEVYPNGQKVQYHKTATVSLKRPDELRSDVKGDNADRLTVLKGEKLVVLDRETNQYQEIKVPAGIDATLDFMLENFNVNVPTSDLLTSNPFKAVFPNVVAGYDLGEVECDGKTCQHVAFRQLEVDWQVWIEKGKTPLPHRIVITDKTLHGNPQYMLIMSKWELSPKFDDKEFDFTPPEGATPGVVLSDADVTDAN
ncbi:DUF2092 domain-containing protein [Desulfovibrio inopinatus]|uniref:DUF2092 domain-containing protein n=1 Tax=Desulfovibrio inopinatus TaxID=102109 RepID=UPI00068854D6|nr:DUF2092 domain-containing protein [Desulfovibrio inopinatus]